jgi:hypothetical protein
MTSGTSSTFHSPAKYVGSSDGPINCTHLDDELPPSYFEHMMKLKVKPVPVVAVGTAAKVCGKRRQRNSSNQISEECEPNKR